MIKGTKASVLLLFLFLAACGSGQEETETKKDIDEKYGYDSPVEVSIALAYAADMHWAGEETPEDNAWLDLYREYNIIPEIAYSVDSSQSEVKQESAILSGNYPDILNGDLSKYKEWVQNGVIADITQAYETYASKELKEYMERENGEILKMLTIDGKLYGIPRIDNSYEQFPMMFIRQDWLENLGLDIPKTMEELEKTAYAFTFQDPDGNGIQDTYGLAIDGINMVTDEVGTSSPVFAAYGAYLGNDTYAFIDDEEGNPVWGGANVEGMEKGLAFLQKLYKDGVICRDAVTMDNNGVFEDAGSGRCGIWFGPYWGGMVPASELLNNNENAKVIAAAVPSGIEGEKTKAYLPSSVRSVYTVSSQCENPEVLVKILNLSVQKIFYPESEEEYYKYGWGDNDHYSGARASIAYLVNPEEGYNIFRVLPKALQTGDTSDLDIRQRKTYENIHAWLEARETGNVNLQDSRQIAGISACTVFEGDHCAWAVIDEMRREDCFLTPAYKGLGDDVIVGNAQTLQQVTREILAKIMTGAESPKAYGDFVKTWESIGGRQVLEAIRDWKEEQKIEN